MKSFWTGALVLVSLVSLSVNVLLYLRDSPHRPLVTFGNEVISRKDYQDALDAQAGKAVLNKMVYAGLVLQAAAKANVMPSDQDVETRLADIRRRSPSVLAAVDQDPARMAQFKQYLTAQIALENLRIQGIAATDMEIASFYARHKTDFTLPAQVQTTVVIADDAASATKAMNLLEQNIPVNVLSLQPRTHVAGVNGYDVDWQRMPPATRQGVTRQLMAMHDADVKIIPVGKDFLVVRVNKNEAAGVPPLDDIKPQVARLVRLQKSPGESAILAALYQQAQPKFQIPKYARFFDDARSFNTRQTPGGQKIAGAQ